MKNIHSLIVFSLLLQFQFQIQLQNLAEAAVSSKSDDYLDKLEREVEEGHNALASAEKLDELLRKDPSNKRAHFILAELFDLRGYSELARQEYEIANQQNPKNARSALRIFQLYWQTKGSVHAGKYKADILKRYPGDPSIPLMEAAEALIANNEFLAEKIYKDALKSHAGQHGIATEFAILKLSQDKYLDAIELAELDLKLKNDDARALVCKAEALMQLGKDDKALPLLRTVYMTKGAYQRQAAQVLWTLFEKHRAFRASLEAALVAVGYAADGDFDAQENAKQKLSVSLKQVSQMDAIATTLNKVLNSMEQDREAQFRMVFACAEILDEHGKLKMAAKLYEKAIELEPRADGPIFCLAQIKQHRGDYAAAEKLYRQALLLNPHEKLIRANLQRLRDRMRIRNRDIAWRIKDDLKF